MTKMNGNEHFSEIARIVPKMVRSGSIDNRIGSIREKFGRSILLERAVTEMFAFWSQSTQENANI
jgi:hypothetical protein